MIISGVQNMAWTYLSNASLDTGKVITKVFGGYVNGVPTLLLVADSYLKSYKIVQLAGGQFIETTGWILNPYASRTGYPTAYIFTQETILMIPNEMRELAIMKFAIDPITGLILYPAVIRYNMPGCGNPPPPVTAIVGFEAPFIDPLGNIIVKNSYSGTMFGGDNISNMSTGFQHSSANDYGINAYYNSYFGGKAPFSSTIIDANLQSKGGWSPNGGNSTTGIEPCQINYGQMVTPDNTRAYRDTYNVYNFLAVANGSGSNVNCNFNTCTINIRLVNQVNTNDLLAGTSGPTIHIPIMSPITSRYDSTFCFSLFRNTIYGGQANNMYGVVGVLPGPVYYRYTLYNTDNNYDASYIMTFLDSQGYVYQIYPGYNKQNGSLNQRSLDGYVSTTTLNLNIDPSKIVRPENPFPVYGMDTNRYFG